MDYHLIDFQSMLSMQPTPIDGNALDVHRMPKSHQQIVGRPIAAQLMRKCYFHAQKIVFNMDITSGNAAPKLPKWLFHRTQNCCETPVIITSYSTAQLNREALNYGLIDFDTQLRRDTILFKSRHRTGD